MYKTSEKWKENIYKNPIIAMNIYINNQLINPNYILEFKKGGEIFNEELYLGSTPSQYIEMKLYKDKIPDNPSKVKVEYGILVNNAKATGKDNSFEMIPIGIYNVDDYADNDDNTITIKALDNMIKFEFNYDGSKLGYPKTLLDIAKDICLKAGVELGSTSFLNSDKQISTYDNQITAREYIGYIAESAGGFSCIGRDGKLYFKSLYQDSTEIPLELFGEYKWSEEFKISKVSYEDGTRSFKFGDDTRNNLWINQGNIYIVDEAQIKNIYDKINGMIINSFEGKTVIDPAIDIGDKIIIDGKPILYQGEMIFEGRFIADISSKIQIKQKEETTTKTESQKIINRRVQSEINQIDGKITQIVEENTETSETLTKHEQTIDKISNIVQSNTTNINNNYQDIIQKLDEVPKKTDIISLENKVETIQSSTDYAIKISEDIQKNGVSKVKTETGYTFDNDGLTIEKTDAKTKSTLNEAGLEVKDNTGSSEETLLFAGYNKETGDTIVKSKNMIVERYLTIGKNSRIEDYESGTGVFWIGGDN